MVLKAKVPAEEDIAKISSSLAVRLAYSIRGLHTATVGPTTGTPHERSLQDSSSILNLPQVFPVFQPQEGYSMSMSSSPKIHGAMNDDAAEPSQLPPVFCMRAKKQDHEKAVVPWALPEMI